MSRRRAAATEAQAAAADWTALAHALLAREVAEAREPAAVAAANSQVRAAEEAFAAAVAGDLPLAAVASVADLDLVSTRVLAVCAAIELDRALQSLVAALRPDRRTGRLDLDMLVHLLGGEALVAVADGAPLRRACLIEVENEAPLASALLWVPRTALWALLLDDLSLDRALPPEVDIVTAPAGKIGSHDLVVVHGEDRVRRVQAAVLAAWGVTFLVCPPPVDDAGWQVLVRQATVAGLGVVLELEGALSPLGRYWLDRADHLSWALCSRHPLALETLPERDFVEVAADLPPAREEEWSAVFPDDAPPQRRPSADQLRQARRVARAGRDPQEAIRRVASGTLLRHATRVVPRARWDDLVLPPAQSRRLHELVDRYRFRARVHEEWGLPLFPSPGVVALFSGPSGTGKTTTAEVIANDLGVDMFRVDLSALVSKYIGETEKNLEEIFSAAHAGDYLLLFDEADSLFGTRSKVSDARDRYANMEVSYLLQRLESYDGFVVLTSNFQGNIDQAFLRRIHVTVHFTMPSVEERVRIWERSLAGAPRTDDLDLQFAAENFDLSGGSIRNAALSAAFLAAGQAGTVGMVELLRAISQELTKLGRRPSDDQFGRWLPALTAD